MVNARRTHAALIPFCLMCGEPLPPGRCALTPSEARFCSFFCYKTYFRLLSSRVQDVPACRHDQPDCECNWKAIDRATQEGRLGALVELRSGAFLDHGPATCRCDLCVTFRMIIRHLAARKAQQMEDDL